MNNWWDKIPTYFTLSRYTVSRKIAAAYLLIVIFSLISIIYALTEMRSQALQFKSLVDHDFRALDLSRDLRRNLLAQERLEQQFLILGDKDLLFLLETRQDEFASLWQHFQKVLEQSGGSELRSLVAEYRPTQLEGRNLLEKQGGQAVPFMRNTLSPLRSRLINTLDDFWSRHSLTIDGSLQEFLDNSQQAYRVTLVLLIFGISLSMPVGISVILGIHGAITRLTSAARKIADGHFDAPLEGDRKDEFGELAREFREMAEKLRELELSHLDANPLTYLPGNRAIDREMKHRLDSGRTFAHLYIDLDHFKAYNDRYGYRKGSDIIELTAKLIRRAVAERGGHDDLIGHIGGDDYVVLTDPTQSEEIAERIIELFDAEVPSFYKDEDREAGFFTGRDRFGEVREFPLMSMSIAIVLSENISNATSQTISHECASIKDHLKSKQGSNYLVDRRKL